MNRFFPSEPSQGPARLEWAAPLLVFALALPCFGWLFTSLPVLYDTDSYYHLAIGRAYASEGPIDTLPWARFSLMREGFGDKEFLFHMFLAPFGHSADPMAAAQGGRWALAVLNALLVAVLTFFGVRAWGGWGLVVPWLVYAGSADFLGRVIRLRPELFSLLLLLAAVACVARGRDRLLGIVVALYTLSYTAFHALLGLSFAWFFVRGWTERRWSAGLLLYPLLGAGAGLITHPHFPHNLTVWKVQSIDFFSRKAELNVGREINPATTDELLWLNLGWMLGCVVLWLAARPDRGPASSRPARQQIASMAWTLHVATAAFGLLFVMGQRFSIYFVPLATLSLVFELRRRGLAPGRFMALPVRGRLPLALMLVLVSVVGLRETGTLLYNLGRAGAETPVTREAEWAAFGRSIPPAGRVAAEWGSTHLYMFWAPQGIYLNVLDPVFMALPYPEVYTTTRAIFEGREPDIPWALEAELDSRFLALSRFHPQPELGRRLANDPRLQLRYRGYTLLYEVVPDANAAFVLDWRVVPEGRPLPPSPANAGDLFPSYPRAERPEERQLEGFIDLQRLDTDGECAAFIHDLETADNEVRRYELAAYGPTTLWLNGRPLLSNLDAPRAVLGAGTVFTAPLAAGMHRLTVLTCRSAGEGGFYLRRLADEVAPRPGRT